MHAQFNGNENISTFTPVHLEKNIARLNHRLLDSLVVECWLRVREVRVQSPVKDSDIPKTL